MAQLLVLTEGFLTAGETSVGTVTPLATLRDEGISYELATIGELFRRDGGIAQKLQSDLDAGDHGPKAFIQQIEEQTLW